MNRIKNLIFDFGKVLVNYDFDLYFSHIISDPEKLAAFSKIMNNPEVVNKMDLGEMSVDEIIGELQAKHPEFSSEFVIFGQRYPEIVLGEVEGMRDLLTQLKQKGYKLYGLSNWCSKVYLTMKQYDQIFGLLDGFVISSDERLIKPNPAIYQRLFEKYNLKPEECVFADDKIENIAGSENVGMKAILFKNAKQYEEELMKLL